MKILALDTATRTGWAVSAGGIYTSGVFDASIRTKATANLPADHFGKRFALFTRWLHNHITENKPDLIVYEKVVGGMNAGGNTSMIQKGLEALVWQNAFAGHIHNDYQPIPVWNFAAATIKKWATGSGILSTQSKIEMCRLAFHTFKDQEWVPGKHHVDDNQADALWILSLTDAVVAHFTHSLFSLQGAIQDVHQDHLTPAANAVTAAKWHANSPANRIKDFKQGIW